jgi:hypothetical protein
MRGGARKGSGRKPGSGKGRKAIAKSVSLQVSDWERIDRERGSVSRSKWIARKIK